MNICNHHCQCGHGFTVTKKRAKVVEERADSNLPTSAIFVDGFWKSGTWNAGIWNWGIGNLLNFTTGHPNSVRGRWTLDLEENV